MNIRARTSTEQFTTMLEFMEIHGDLARPVGGPQGRVRSDRLWFDLTNSLNAIGGGTTKSTDKWRKVWADWKSKTKKKSLLLRRAANGTGGGPASHQSLSDIDQRVLGLMGPLAVLGQDSIEELGFIIDNPTALPSSQPVSTSVMHNDSMMQMDNMDDELLVTSLTSQLPPRPPHTTLELIPAEILERPPNPELPLQPLTPQPPSPPPPPPPRLERRRPNASPPPARRRLSTTPLTPHSAGSSRRPHVHSRRRRGPTPFERAANEFTAVEMARLELEERRAQQMTQLEERRALQIIQLEEKRAQQIIELEDKRTQQMMQLEHKRVQLHHERELRALAMEEERTRALFSIVNIASQYFEYLRSNTDTEPINNDE